MLQSFIILRSFKYRVSHSPAFVARFYFPHVTTTLVVQNRSSHWLCIIYLENPTLVTMVNTRTFINPSYLVSLIYT